MTRNKAYDVAAYNFAADDCVVPDANIWLYLYAPAGVAYPTYLKQAIASYSKAWKVLLSRNVKVLLDAIVLCEVINRLLDNEWQRIDPPDAVTKTRRYAKRKHFRKSAEYPAAASSVESLARLIIADAHPLDHLFSKCDLDSLLSDFGSGSTDWNDQLLVENCRCHGMKLMTHDADHTHGGIEVLTANQRLLAACP